MRREPSVVWVVPPKVSVRLVIGEHTSKWVKAVSDEDGECSGKMEYEQRRFSRVTEQPSSSNYPARLHFAALPGKAISAYSFLHLTLHFAISFSYLSHASMPGSGLVCIYDVAY